MSGYWENDDGLQVKFGTVKPENELRGGSVVESPIKTIVLNMSFDDLPSFTSDLNNDGTLNGFSNQDAKIPAGASIISARYKIGTAWTNGTGTADLLCGTYEQDGSVIDADGLIGATEGDLAQLTINTIVDGAGADIGEHCSATADAYIVVSVSAGTMTAGTGKVIVEYME